MERVAPSYRSCLTAMDRHDDIEVGDSYFITGKNYLQHLKKRFYYFFIDELFKGTNTIEGGSVEPWDCPLVGCPKLPLPPVMILRLVSASGEVNDNYHFDSRYVDGKMRL